MQQVLQVDEYVLQIRLLARQAAQRQQHSTSSASLPLYLSVLLQLPYCMADILLQPALNGLRWCRAGVDDVWRVPAAHGGDDQAGTLQPRREVLRPPTIWWPAGPLPGQPLYSQSHLCSMHEWIYR